MNKKIMILEKKVSFYVLIRNTIRVWGGDAILLYNKCDCPMNKRLLWNIHNAACKNIANAKLEIEKIKTYNRMA